MTAEIQNLQQNKDGEAYTRPPSVMAGIRRLMVMELTDILSDASIRDRKHENHIKSEALFHLLRGHLKADRQKEFTAIYIILERRIDAILRSRGYLKPGNKRQSLSESEIRDGVFDKLTARLMEDRDSYCKGLDFFECNFFSGITNLAGTAYKSAKRKAAKSAPFYEEDTLSPVREAEGKTEEADWVSAYLDNTAFRSDFLTAIESLPEDQKKVMLMIIAEIPADSKDKDKVTIASLLGVTPRTVHNLKTRALKTLRVNLRRHTE